MQSSAEYEVNFNALEQNVGHYAQWHQGLVGQSFNKPSLSLCNLALVTSESTSNVRYTLHWSTVKQAWIITSRRQWMSQIIRNTTFFLVILPDVCHAISSEQWEIGFLYFPIIHFPGNLFYAHLCSGKRWDWSSNRGLSRFTTLHLTPNGLFLTLYFQLRQELIMHPKGCHVPLFSNFHSAQFDNLGGDGEIFREISGEIFQGPYRSFFNLSFLSLYEIAIMAARWYGTLA